MTPDTNSLAEHGASWTAVTSGLRLYFRMILSQVAVQLVFGFIVTSMAMNGGAREVATLTPIAGVIGLVLSAFACAGLIRYKQIPVESGAAGTAGAAASLAIGGVVISTASLIIQFMAMASPSMARDLEGLTTAVTVLAAIVGIAVFYTLMVSLREAANALSLPVTAKRASTTMVIISVVIGCAALLVLAAQMQSRPLLALFGLAALGLGIWGLVFQLMVISEVAKGAEKISVVDVF